MSADLQPIADQIALAAYELPIGVLKALVQRLQTGSDPGWPARRLAALGVTAQPQFRDCIDRLMRAWRQFAPDGSPLSVALALLAACSAADTHRSEQDIELVWTGPDTHTIPLRRTDQVLLQVIHEAKTSLLISSFAVYKVEEVSQALVHAADRGVRAAICLETPESGQQRVHYDTVGALGKDVLDRVQVYVWPMAQRPGEPDRRVGSLHAKCAVADESLLFITSANLTQYAMERNMELGVLIRGGTLPEKVARHFALLMEAGILVPFQNTR